MLIGMTTLASAWPTPFQPRKSPFHAKGIIWLAVQQTMEARVPGGVAAVCEAMPAHSAFLSQIFIASGHYDILPVAELAPVAAKLAGTTAEEYVKTAGKVAAEAWMQGIHKSILQQTSPVDVCKRFASMMRQLYNFGRPELVAITEGSVEAVTGDIPEPIVWWWTTSSRGYLEVVVRAAGGKDGGIRFREPQLETVRHGVRIMKVPNTTYWG